VHLRIADKEGVLEINFSGDVEHDVMQPKAKRITGKPHDKNSYLKYGKNTTILRNYIVRAY
jgi:hypothetical protein